MVCLIVVMNSFVAYVVKWQWLAVEFDLDSGISLRVEPLVTKTILYIQNVKPCSPVFSEARSCDDATAYEHTSVYERFRIRKKRTSADGPYQSAQVD